MAKPTRVTNSIRALRFAHGGMTQADLADRLGVTRHTQKRPATPRNRLVPTAA